MKPILVKVKGTLLRGMLPNLGLMRSGESTVYEHEVADFCAIPDGKCFLDVGANVGVYTLRMASKAVCVHAFEPSLDIYEVLRENVRHLPNVTTYPFALSDKNNEVNFILLSSEHVANRFLVTNPETVLEFNPDRLVKVPARTLDSLGICNVGLIKVDVEGHESQVLRGAIETLKQQKPTLIVEVHPPIWRNDIRCMAILHEAGYKRIKRVWRSHHRKYFIVTHD